MVSSLGQSHRLTGLGPAPQGPAPAIQPPLCERGWLSSSPSQELSVLNPPLVNYLNIVCVYPSVLEHVTSFIEKFMEPTRATVLKKPEGSETPQTK